MTPLTSMTPEALEEADRLLEALYARRAADRVLNSIRTGPSPSSTSLPTGRRVYAPSLTLRQVDLLRTSALEPRLVPPPSVPTFRATFSSASAVAGARSTISPSLRASTLNPPRRPSRITRPTVPRPASFSRPVTPVLPVPSRPPASTRQHSQRLGMIALLRSILASFSAVVHLCSPNGTHPFGNAQPEVHLCFKFRLVRGNVTFCFGSSFQSMTGRSLSFAIQRAALASPLLRSFLTRNMERLALSSVQVDLQIWPTSSQHRSLLGSWCLTSHVVAVTTSRGVSLNPARMAAWSPPSMAAVFADLHHLT